MEIGVVPAGGIFHCRKRSSYSRCSSIPVARARNAAPADRGQCSDRPCPPEPDLAMEGLRERQTFQEEGQGHRLALLRVASADGAKESLSGAGRKDPAPAGEAARASGRRG